VVWNSCALPFKHPKQNRVHCVIVSDVSGALHNSCVINYTKHSQGGTLSCSLPSLTDSLKLAERVSPLPAEYREGSGIVAADGKSRTVTTSGTDAKGKKITSTAVYDKE
jgi:hypothetical protein